MTRIISVAAFILGALVVVWMASAFVGSNVLALGVTVLIAAAYAMGFAELLRYQQASTALGVAIASVDDTLQDIETWLSTVPSVLRNAVRQRIQGEYIRLPAPVLSPYIIGLLVMLGLLGTFIGMVATLKGAVVALEGSNELEAVRAGLAAPIKGLSMAFATSVAGVCASAMLGLISTLSRRERLQISRELDASLNTVFKSFSLNQQRRQSYQAMQSQAEVLPEVAQQLTVLVDTLGRMGGELAATLTKNQEQFHGATQAQYKELANSVDASLKQSLADSGRIAGEHIAPVIATLVRDLRADMQANQQHLTVATEAHLQHVDERHVASTDAFSEAWQRAISSQQTGNETLLSTIDHRFTQLAEQFASSSQSLVASFNTVSEDWVARQQTAEQERLANWSAVFDQSADLLRSNAEALSVNARAGSQELIAEFSKLVSTSEALVAERQQSESRWFEAYQQRMTDMTAAISGELHSLTAQEEQRSQAAVARLAELQTAVKEHLASLAKALEEPMARLIDSASETPRVAAEIMAKLREEMNGNIERDNSLLDERRELMVQLNSLSESLQMSAAGQREAVENILANSSNLLADIGQRFGDNVEKESSKLSDVVAHFEGSSAELASLGDTFATAVNEFSQSNSGLIETLLKVESGLQGSGERSDEQMAYYVAQAREIIDHNMLSHQDIIRQLQAITSHAVAEEGE
ncbi:Uncharacterised protein [Zhongshania aliphaticivorans]|uniref:DUF802 domain-containing protein n=1 Tax=Zhongshania aliphaticivorans TaxID=1470434 RepID=A0A5S9QJF3_9GAMM|nr:DUF802 domain-containing protein [Zhongshania aliphaticivorans]CAA0110406.1 Uncharacterised protein [Zhongshania aliphaticivorans]CAA0118123.1 Uncharacterised protein [Zhongshania aliphaticivorans]CAA0122078.1 Uncharacterised protein [Zhongshania aliphaticivorans]